MKRVLTLCVIAAFALLTACGEKPETAAVNSNAAGAASNARDGGATKGGASAGEIGIVSSHGGAAGTAQQPPQSGGGGGSDRSLAETKELDARIKRAAEKAKAEGASAADKKEAASAYLARGNVYWAAGQPRLYKYALADFKAVLRYDPSNEEAKEKIETIEGIYRGMGRPIPEVSPEQ